MVGSKGLRVGIIAAVVAAAASMAILAGPAYAQGPSVSVSSASVDPGAQGTVSVSAAEIAGEGLGAWTLDVEYDPAVLTVVGCDAATVGINLCNPAYDADSDTTPEPIVRFAGSYVDTSPPPGLTGTFDLGTITFQCANAEADSPLTLTASVFADATTGAPQPINPTVNSGTFSCAVQPTATGTSVPPTPTSTVRVISGTGTGPGDSGSDIGWVIAALAGSGLALFAGLGALRVRMRRA